jgi:hypothetical protein
VAKDKKNVDVVQVNFSKIVAFKGTLRKFMAWLENF